MIMSEQRILNDYGTGTSRNLLDRVKGLPSYDIPVAPTQGDVSGGGGGGVPRPRSTSNEMRHEPPNDGFAHPWKATENGDEYINVARGHIMGFKPYTDGTYGSPDFFLPFIEILQTYAGGTVEITQATGFIYATCTVTSSVEGNEGAFAGGDIGGNLYRPDAAPTLVFSDVAIASYAPNDAKVHFLVAEVSKTEGVAAVEEQLLFHNPSMQLDSLYNIP